jgi:hypothetical protein
MNGTNNRLRLTLEQIKFDDDQDANLDAVINLKPFGGEPPLVLTFTLKEDGVTIVEISVDLNREQALILGQFMLLATHVKEPD